jgi:hypothetical protein
VFVQNPIKTGIKHLRVFRQFLLSITYPRVEIVAVNFEDKASGVNKRDRTLDVIFRFDYGRFDARVPKRVFKQAVEIRCYDDTNIAIADKFRDCPMCS